MVGLNPIIYAISTGMTPLMSAWSTLNVNVGTGCFEESLLGQLGERIPPFLVLRESTFKPLTHGIYYL